MSGVGRFTARSATVAEHQKQTQLHNHLSGEEWWAADYTFTYGSSNYYHIGLQVPALRDRHAVGSTPFGHVLACSTEVDWL